VRVSPHLINIGKILDMEKNITLNRNTRKLTYREKALSLFLRALPIKNGKHRILDYIRNVPWGLSTCPNVEFRYKNTDLVINIDDLVGWHFSILRSFDPEVVDVLTKLASPDTEHVYWDIGFNKGVCSFAIAKAMPNSKIVAIEPQAELKELNEVNLKRICPDRFEYYQLAIGLTNEILSLVIPEKNKGKATLHCSTITEDSITEDIQIVTPQTIVAQSDFGWPTLVKIDVEGHEPHVIRSLLPALKDHHCDVIVFENHFHEIENLNIIKDISKDRGYSLFGISKTIFTTKLIPVKSVAENITDYALVSQKVIANKRIFQPMLK